MNDAGDSLSTRDVAVEVTDRPGPAWDELTAHFADAAYEQSVAYTASRWGERRLVGIVLRDAGRRVVATALAVTVELPLVNAGFAHVKFGPLWRPRGGEASPGILTQALVALRRELGERRRLLVRVMPPVDPGFEPAWHAALSDTGFVLSADLPHPERYLLDLSLPDDEQLASFGDRWRAQLKKAVTDLTFEELTGPSALEQFLRLFQSMLQRKQFDDRHGLDALPALLSHPVAAHRTRMFVAWHQREPVAISAVGGAGDTLHAMFGATSDSALPLRAGYALRWWILGRLRDRGARWLDLGGDEGDEGLRHYKKGCVGKRGRIVSLLGEFDWCDRPLSRLATQAIGLARDAPILREVSRFLRRQ
jgi:hypothetical protein